MTLRQSLIAAAGGAEDVGAPVVPNWDTIPNPPNGTVGVVYNYNLAAHLNTTSGVVITVTGGVLPAGLTISGLAISGVPNTQELASGLQLTATNVSGADQSAAFDIDIATVVTSGDITATDPLGLSAGQDIVWTVLDEPIDPPPGGPGKRWNPGHYLRVQGDAMDPNQVAYEDKVLNTINNDMNDSPLILGAHIGISWGAMNPTGGTFDFSFLDQVRDLVEASGKRWVCQLQYKGFSSRTAPNIEAPADIFNEIVAMNQGFTATIWKTAIMSRYIDAIVAIANRYDNDDSFELLIPTESAPSLGGVDTSGYDYSVVGLGIELKRMYAAGAAACVKANFASNINSLGEGSNDNQITGLMEECYQLRCMIGGPDAQPTTAWNAFEGINPSSGPPAVRDYRNQLGAFYTISNQVLNVETPATIINNMQGHESTHYSWISGHQGQSWNGAIIPAIEADPAVHTACPLRYDSCEV